MNNYIRPSFWISKADKINRLRLKKRQDLTTYEQLSSGAQPTIEYCTISGETKPDTIKLQKLIQKVKKNYPEIQDIAIRFFFSAPLLKSSQQITEPVH